jgi:signal transduction histidine kinase
VLETSTFDNRDVAKIRTASDLAKDALAALAESAPEGIAILHPDDASVRWANAEAARLLTIPEVQHVLIAGRALAELRDDEVAVVAAGFVELECLSTLIDLEHDSLRVVRFRDVSAERRRDRELRAFSNTSASIAFSCSLTEVLDRMAEEVKLASGMFSCTFLFIEGHTVVRQAGKSGLYPAVEDYTQRLNACTALGAPLIALDAYDQRAPIIVEQWRERTLADPRFAPIHDINVEAQWSAIAVVPLIVRDEIIGVFNGFYLPGHEPRLRDLPFLTAIADQAAVAVDNARLLEALEAKAALEERHRLARELHDSVSQALFSLTMQARAVELIARQDEPDLESVGVGLADIRELTAGALAEMRALIFQLRPAALHEEGLVSAIRKHAAAITASQRLAIEVIGPEEGLGLAENVEREIFRLVQEALNNVVKHADARHVKVRIAIPPDAGRDLYVEVCDDGNGFDPSIERPGHLGLTSMRERVEALHGRLELHSTATGTVLHAHIPHVIDLREGQAT